jgi:hypothetical protein
VKPSFAIDVPVVRGAARARAALSLSKSEIVDGNRCGFQVRLFSDRCNFASELVRHCGCASKELGVKRYLLGRRSPIA